jgi:hypothetical protein
VPPAGDAVTCPACGYTNTVSATRCRTCGITLFQAPPGAGPRGDVELVPLLRTGDYALIPVLTSLLESEGIDYILRGAKSGDPLAFYRGGAGSSMPGGLSEFVVRAPDLDRARQLLADLLAAELPEDWEPQVEDTELEDGAPEQEEE